MYHARLVAHTVKIIQIYYLPCLGLVQWLIRDVHDLLKDLPNILFSGFLIRGRGAPVVRIHRLHPIPLGHHSNLRSNWVHHATLFVHNNTSSCNTNNRRALRTAAEAPLTPAELKHQLCCVVAFRYEHLPSPYNTTIRSPHTAVPHASSDSLSLGH